MSNFRDIIRNHNATYYDYDTGDQKPVWLRYVLVAFGSIGLVLICETVPSEMLGALLTVQSILIGFSFSVMFFLLSGSLPTIADNGSIEAGLKKEKLAKLARELFYNVSYFNVIALVSVLLSLLLLLPSIDVDALVEWIKKRSVLTFWTEASWRSFFATVIDWLKPALEFMLYATLLESLTSFARTVGRVSFYFERKLNTEGGT
ncbi:hypothetical protein [uncultured Tateyamaria sp.]|uniref:hypothetical protein n=1 Tax=uncultured Tateyamaria sp. TaxID=455651 RepID=UPI0026396D12|nr:hypothetical protein [uncultured Tateyamaria sp.]